MGLHIVRAVLNHLIELHHREIFVIVLGIVQRLIIAMHIVRADSQNCGLSLNLIEIMVCDIVIREEIHADDPLHQRIGGLSALKKDQAEQIPRILLVFIKEQGALQKLRGAGKVPEPRPLQTQIVIAVGDALQGDIIFHRIPSSLFMASSMSCVMISFMSVRSTFTIASSI